MTNDKSEKPVELNTQESWQKAQKYCGVIGTVPSSFSSLVRSLATDQIKNNKKTTYNVRAQVVRLLKGPTMAALFYYACKTYREDKLASDPQMNIGGMVDLFEPLDLAAIIGMIFLFRRCKKQSSGEHWDTISQMLQSESEIGAYLGNAVPSIGLGTGLLVGGIHQVALSAFQQHDKEGFGRYLGYLRRVELEVDLKWEMERWGCTHLQVSSILLQNLGFGKEIAEGIVRGLDPAEQIQKITDSSHYRIKIIRVWIDSLLETGDQPTITMRGEYYPLEAARNILKDQVAALREKGPKYSWLERVKDDLTPEALATILRRGSAPAGAPVQEQAEDESGTSEEESLQI